MPTEQTLDIQAQSIPQAILLQLLLLPQLEFIQAHLPYLAHLTQYLQVYHQTLGIPPPRTSLTHLARLTLNIPTHLIHLIHLVHLHLAT